MARYRVEPASEEREAPLARVGKGRGSAVESKRANMPLAVDCGGFGDLRTADGEAARV